MNKYDLKLDMENKNSLSIICGWIKPNTTVLEFGPAYGRLTKYLTEKLNCTVDIVELDVQAGKEAAKYARTALIGNEAGNIENYLWAEKYRKETYDYIVFADVLEHLKAPDQVLKRVKSYLKNTGEVLVSIPNIAHNSILANLYNDKFNYTELGILDYTHIRFWGRENFSDICNNLGLSVKKIDAVTADLYSTEQSIAKGKLPEELEALLKIRNYGEVYQWVFKLVNKDAGIYYTEEEEACKTKFPMAIYIDVGEGYNEEKKIADSVYFYKRCIKEFDLSNFSNIKKIRIDPIEGTMCKLNLLKISSSFGLENAIPLNRLCHVENKDWFETYDPNYEIIVENRKIEKLRVEFLLEPLSYLEIINKLKLLYESSMSKEILTQGQLEQTQGQLEQTQGQLEQTQGQLEQTQGHVAQLESELEQIQTDMANIQQMYDTIRNSQFWKITKPLRRLCDKIKKTNIGNLLYKTCYYLKRGKLCFITKSKLNKYLFKHKVAKKHENNSELLLKSCKMLGGEIYLQESLKIIANERIKKVLLISHDLSMTGAPIALHYMAKILKKNNFCPIIVSPFDGRMASEIVLDDIPVIIMPNLQNNEWLTSISHIFNCIVANTAVTSYVIKELANKSTNVVWWVHEAKASYVLGELDKELPHELPDNVKVYCVGDYAQRVFNNYRPNIIAETLLYCVPEPQKNNIKSKIDILGNKNNGKMVFAIIGTFEERKAQDKLVEAIYLLQKDVLDNSLFVFVGKRCCDKIDRAVEDVLIKLPNNIVYTEELTRQEMFSLYNYVDCAICTSKDDPMPIVMTEALMFSKLVICSEFTGTAYLLEQYNAGFVYYNNSTIELKQKIEYVFANYEHLTDIKINARKLYENKFSSDVFQKSVLKMMGEIGK